MDAQKAKDLEEAIEFGKTISFIDNSLGWGIGILTGKGPMYTIQFKEDVASRLSKHRQFIQEIVDTVDQKYAGIKVAEKAKAYALERLKEFEEAAKPYLK